MAYEKDEKAPAFKVVDKRAMAEEDDGCCGGHHHHHESEELHGSAPESDMASHGRARPPMSFSLFVQSLAHQSMMGLGIVPWPDSGLVKVELDLAKETIDILQILRDKSKGNLSNDEQVMLDSLLYQLQIAFVEISNGPQGASEPLIK